MKISDIQSIQDLKNPPVISFPGVAPFSVPQPRTSAKLNLSVVGKRQLPTTKKRDEGATGSGSFTHTLSLSLMINCTLCAQYK